MIDNIVALYSITDDLLKAIRHKDDARRQCSDAEVLTTAFTAVLYFGGNPGSGAKLSAAVRLDAPDVE